MSLIQVPDEVTFEYWRDKTNELGVAIGDFDNFNPDVDPLFGGASDPNLVSAINSLFIYLSNTDRLLLIRCMAMS